MSGITEQQDDIGYDDELIESATAKKEREEIYSADDNDYQPVPDVPDNDSDEQEIFKNVKGR